MTPSSSLDVDYCAAVTMKPVPIAVDTTLLVIDVQEAIDDPR
jgi:hypothetical protein